MVVLIFLPLSPLTQHPPLPQAISPPLSLSMGHECKFFGCSISYTALYLHPHDYSVTTYLYFLIPSPLHPFSPFPLSSGNHLVSNFFSLAVFKSLSLFLNFWPFTNDVSWSGPLCIHHNWDSLCFLDLHVYFLH